MANCTTLTLYPMASISTKLITTDGKLLMLTYSYL